MYNVKFLPLFQPTPAGSCPKDTPPTKGEETAPDYIPGGRGRKESWAGYGSQFGDFGTGILRTGARSKEELSRFWRNRRGAGEEDGGRFGLEERRFRGGGFGMKGRSVGRCGRGGSASER